MRAVRWALVSLILSACAAQIQQADQAAQAAADSALVLGRIGYCDAPTLGALRRAYGPDLAGLRRHLLACGWTPEAAAAVTGGGE